MKSIKYINYISESTKNILNYEIISHSKYKLSKIHYNHLHDIKRLLVRYKMDQTRSIWWLAYFNEHPYYISSSGNVGNIIESPAAVLRVDFNSGNDIYQVRFAGWLHVIIKQMVSYESKDCKPTFIKEAERHYNKYFNHGY